MIFNRASLLDLLRVVAGVMPARPPKPILACVRIVAADRAIALTGTNLSAWVVSRTAEAQVEQPFDTAVDCEDLLNVVGAMGDATLSLALVGTQMVIRGSAGTFKLPALNPGEFPPLPATVAVQSVTIPAPEFARLVRQSVVAVAKQTQGFAISGVFVVVTGKGRVEFAATESHMLAVPSTACDKKAKAFTALVSPEALQLAQRSAAEDDEISFGVAEGNQVIIDAGDTRVISTQIEGQFPPYNDIIPKGCDKTALVGREALRDFVKQATVIATGDEGRNCLKLTFTPKRGVNVFAQSRKGETDINLPCKVDAGEELVIGLNAKWFGDGISEMTGDELRLEMSAPNRAVCVRDGADYLLVILPMSLT